MDSIDLLIVKSDVDYEMLSKIDSLTSNRSANTLYILLETSGGLPMAAMKTMEILDCRYKTIYAIVCNVAMSAGTLMCLGCNKIYMGDGACLGPLDLQIPHPNDDSQISTLDVRDTMLSLMSQTAIIAQQFAEEHGKMGISRTAAVKMGYEAAIKLVSPIADKIDPYHYRESFRNAEMGAVYGKILLTKRMMLDKEDLAEVVAMHLANRYMAHNYMIFQKEAKEKLLLDVEHINKLPQNILQVVKKEWRNCGNLFNSPNTIYEVEIRDTQLPKAANKQHEDKEHNNDINSK